MKTKLFFIIFLLAGMNASAQWVKTNGPMGITVDAFLNKGNLLFAGTDAKGIYKSLDHGLTWTESNIAATKNLEVLSLAYDDTYLYAGTLEAGIYASDNDGQSWHPAGLQNQAVYCMLSANGYLFAGTIGGGMFRSPDHGATWEDINQNLLTSSFIWSMVYQNHRLIVEADNYLFFSTDDGDSWDIDQGTTAFFRIEKFFHHGDTLLASAGSVIFRSTDGGVNWGPFQQVNVALCGFAASNDTIYAGYKYGVLRSVDWGQTWTNISSADMRYGTRFQNDFTISGSNMLTAFEEIGIYVSQDKGLNWTQSPLANFSRSSSEDDAMIRYKQSIITGTHSDGVYKTTDQGNNWTRLGTPVDTDTLSNEIVFAMQAWGNNVLLAGTCGDGLFRSTDAGSTWNHIYNGLPIEPTTHFTCIKSFAISGPNVIAALTAGVYYSSDSGLTWHPSTILGGITVLEASGLAVRNNIVCVGITASPGRGVYRSTDNGQTFSLAEGLLDIETMKEGGGSNMYCGSLFDGYRSIDDGLTWGGLGPGIPPGAGTFAILAWDDYVFIGNSAGVFFSSNAGVSFSDVSQGMNPYPNNAVQGLTRDDDFIYAGTYKDGVWRRPLSQIINVVPLTMGRLTARYDGRAGRLDWQTFTETNVSHFEIERSTNGADFTTIGKLTASGNSNSTIDYHYDDDNPLPGLNYYRIKAIDVDGKFKYSNVAEIRVIKDGIVQVYPNPFTDHIDITIHAAQDEQVNFRLLDETGRLLKMQKEDVAKGHSTVPVNGLKGLAKGMYFLEIRTGEDKQVYRLTK